jgi:hypothetical protein
MTGLPSGSEDGVTDRINMLVIRDRRKPTHRRRRKGHPGLGGERRHKSTQNAKTLLAHEALYTWAEPARGNQKQKQVDAHKTLTSHT